MGRREQGAGRLEPSGEPSGRAWGAVRRALGRLVAHVAVRDLPQSEMTPPVAVRVSAFAQPPLSAGVREHDWKPACETNQSPVPQAGAGARDGNLLPVVRLAEGSAALALPVCRAMPVVQTGGCRVENADLLLPAFVVRLPNSFLTLPADPVRVQSAGLLTALGASAPPGRRLKGWDVEAPKIGALRLPRAFQPPIHWGGDAILSRIALTRRRLEAPPEVPFALAFGAEERRLAEAAQLPPQDVTLLGIYPGVPILAVSRIVVADEGRLLRLWLKPDILRGRNGTRLITLLVGRQKSSGKTLQASL